MLSSAVPISQVGNLRLGKLPAPICLRELPLQAPSAAWAVLNSRFTCCRVTGPAGVVGRMGAEAAKSCQLMVLSTGDSQRQR